MHNKAARRGPRGGVAGLAIVSFVISMSNIVSGPGVAAEAGLPAPWVSTDIGAVGVPGSASHSEGVFTVHGSGTNISSRADAFHYVHRSLTGDDEVVARVTSLQAKNRGAKAGLMIRESLFAGSRHATITVMRSGGVTFQSRSSTNGGTSSISAAAATTPHWLRLQRQGSTITAYQSVDRSAWVTVGTRTIDMASTVYVGLALTSHDNSRLSTATFDSLSPPSTPDTTAPTVSITSPADRASISGAVEIGVDATDTVGVTNVELFVDGTFVSADTSAPYVFAWDPQGAGGERVLEVKAHDAAGNASSAAISVTVEADADPRPTPPGNLAAAAVSATEVELAWTASTGPSGVAGYTIMRDGVAIATSDTTSVRDVVPAGTYTYLVTAFDAMGNTSDPSNQVTYTAVGIGTVWAMAGSSLQNVREVDDTSARAHFDHPGSSVTGPGDGRHNQVPAGWSMTPVANYKSYAAFRADIDAGKIQSDIRWVKYNPEKWEYTPLNEQEDPGYYMRKFCEVAHAGGFRCSTAPARSLLLVPTAVCHIDYSIDDDLNEAYLRCKTAEQGAKYADQFGIQAQINQGDPAKYRDFVMRAAQQAKAVNGDVQLISNLTTNLQEVHQSSCVLYEAHKAVEGLVAGHWLHVDSATGSVAVSFLKNIDAGRCVSTP